MELPSSALWNAFIDGCRIATENGSNILECHDIGSLVLPTGRIVACDPYFDVTQQPFTERVDCGNYPVFLAVDAESRTVALAMVQFSDGRPTSWSVTEPGWFPVDSAMACFMDVTLARRLMRAKNRGRFDRYWKRVSDEMEENGGNWANVCLGESMAANMIVIKTFGGDGAFSSYWGYSMTGQRVCLVADFFLESWAL